MHIDFYLSELDEAILFANIARSLTRRGVAAHLVLEPPGRHTATTTDAATQGMTADAYDELRLRLVERRIPHLAAGDRRADVVVTTGPARWVAHYDGVKLRIVDGGAAPFDRAIAVDELSGFDGLLVSGPWAARRLARRFGDAAVRQIGSPRLAALARDAVSRRESALRFGLSPSRRTAVVLAAHGDSCNQPRYADAIDDLGRSFNVLYKPDPWSLRFAPERHARLRRSPRVLVAETEHDLATFLAVADVIVADIPGRPFTEALVADRPLVAVGTDAEAIGSLAGAATVCTSPADLTAAVARSLTTDATRARAAARSLALARGVAPDDDVAARALLDLATSRHAPLSAA